MIIFSSVLSSVSNLLGIKFIPGLKHYNSHISNELNRAYIALNNNKITEFKLVMNKISFFCQHLNVVKNYDEALYRKIKRKLLDNSTIDNFHGERFELNITASLVTKNLKIVKQESPDFKVDFNNYNIFIECGSARVREKYKIDDMTYKVSSVINKKDKKSYAKPDTLLFIDFTNIVNFHLQYDVPIEDFLFRSKIQKNTENSKFAGVLLFLTRYNMKLDRMEHNYVRFDNINQLDFITLFLNKYYPRTEMEDVPYGVPYEG